MIERGRRLAACVLMAVGLFVCNPLSAQNTELPTGFGPLTLGMPWSEAEGAGDFTELTRPTTTWERYVHDCGYRSARFAVNDGSVLVTAQDHAVTALSYATPIQRGSDVMKVAGLVIENYGQPRRATLRDDLGAVTIEQARANHALLEYSGAVDAAFSISGDPLWEYRITVNDRNTRRLENRTIRCARTQEKDAATNEKKS